jgi:hypothetical protein
VYPLALLPVTQGVPKVQSAFSESVPLWPVSPQVEATVKATPLLATSSTVTTTFPVVAPLGTVVPMLVVLQLVTVAAVPLKLTVLVPWEDPKFEPVIVTAVPTGPDVGDRLVMLGATGAAFTVKVAAVLVMFPTELLTTTRNVAPLSALVVEGVV